MEKVDSWLTLTFLDQELEETLTLTQMSHGPWEILIMMVRVQIIFPSKDKLDGDTDRLSTRKYLLGGTLTSHTVVQMLSKYGNI